MTDGAPSCPDPERPACQRSGALRGACTECTSTNSVLCGGVKPVCVADLGVCGCAGATDDRSCGAADSGLICSGPGGLCVPGCGTSPRNGCPTGQTCLDIVSGVGQCSGAMCHADVDCRAPLAHCDLSNGPDGRCVQCLFDTDCDAPLICDPIKRTCIECTPADTTQCRPELTGSQCLLDGRCGCTADSDCGSVTSGRVCDAASSRCVTGCRGTGGNGCPLGEACSSTTADPGRCETSPPSGDGGVVDGGNSDAGNAADGGAVDGSGGAGGNGSGGANGRGGASGSGVGGQAGGAAGGAGGSGATGGAGVTGGGGSTGATDAGDADGGDAGIGVNGLDRFIAGGGCHCATAPGRNGGWLATLLGLALLGIRRRRRDR